MDKLLFWLGIGAAQKGAGSRPAVNRYPVISFVVGILIAVLIAVGAFVLWSANDEPVWGMLYHLRSGAT